MTAVVMDMTGRVLEAGESVDADRFEQLKAAEARDFWKEVPGMVRYMTDNNFDHLSYAEVTELIVHSLLTEAKQASDEHDRAAEVLDWIRGQFFAADE